MVLKVLRVWAYVGGLGECESKGSSKSGGNEDRE